MAGNKNSGHRLDKEKMMVASLARKHTVKAIQKLAHLMDKAENEAVQKSAADSLLDRGWGRPAQAVTVKGDEENPVKMIISWSA